MKILITGSAGFIGFHLIRNLLIHINNIDAIYGIDNMNSYYNVNLKKDRNNLLLKYSTGIKRYNFIHADICDYENINYLVENVDVVVNLAAQAGVRHSFIKPFDYIHSNINGFFNVLDACRRHKKKLIYASSSSVYGSNETPWSECQEVNTPLSLYASTKISNEMLAHSYFNMYNDMTLIGLRFFTVWGEFGRPDMAIWLWTEAMLNNNPIKLFNNGNMYRDFTHINDISNGIISCINKDFKPCSEIFNLGNNKTEKIEDVVSLISNYLNIKPKIEYLPMQLGDVYKTYANIDKAKRELNFNPKISIEDRIKFFIDWYREYHKI